MGQFILPAPQPTPPVRQVPDYPFPLPDGRIMWCSADGICVYRQ
jgi:hypothetical protein